MAHNSILKVGVDCNTVTKYSITTKKNKWFKFTCRCMLMLMFIALSILRMFFQKWLVAPSFSFQIAFIFFPTKTVLNCNAKNLVWPSVLVGGAQSARQTWRYMAYKRPDAITARAIMKKCRSQTYINSRIGTNLAGISLAGLSFQNNYERELIQRLDGD